MSVSLTSHSTALFSTWHFLEEWGLLFDAGDGLTMGLGAKARKVKHVFVSHADRDHLAGLVQFMQLNGRPRGLTVYYPADCGSFPALQAFSRAFDPHIDQADWVGVTAESVIPIGKGRTVRVLRNDHIPAGPDEHKSFSFIVSQKRQKLRPEFVGLPGEQIGALRLERGADHIMEETEAQVLGYSGDTPGHDPAVWRDVHTLIHEATFVDSADLDLDNPRRNKHCCLADVMTMVAQTRVQHLVLSHFSIRYSREYIQREVQRLISHHGLALRVDLILPGEVSRICLDGL